MTPIERAARALCELDGQPPMATMEGKPLWQSYVPEVRAVLTAIRAPSDEMMNAAHGVEDDFDSAAGHRDRGRTYAQHVWPAMIEALLEEGK